MWKKYLGINLTLEVKDLCNENLKHQKKKRNEDDTRDGKTFRAHGSTELYRGNGHVTNRNP